MPLLPNPRRRCLVVIQTQPDTNLAIFFHPEAKSVADMEGIEERIRKLDPGIKVHLFSTLHPHRWTPLRLWTRPTVTVELNRPSHFNLIRGRRFRQLRRGKIDTGRRLQEAGLPVPRFEVITPETVLDPAVWGPYVVVKPELGGRGAYVRIQRTGRVRHQAPHELPEDHPGRHGPMIVQQFIYTGRWPVAHRVLTLFGEPLLAVRQEGRRDFPPLEGPDAFGRAGGGMSVVAAAKGCTITLENDPAILEFARRVHAALPELPLLGQDIIRDATTGQLYVVEVNPNGDVWLLSNRSGRQAQAEFNLDLYQQFGALDIAARVLTGITRRFAE